MVCSGYCVEELSRTDWWHWWCTLNERYLSRLLPILVECCFDNFIHQVLEHNFFVKMSKSWNSSMSLYTENKPLLSIYISFYFNPSAFESCTVAQHWGFTFPNNTASEFTPLLSFVIPDFFLLETLEVKFSQTQGVLLVHK